MHVCVCTCSLAAFLSCCGLSSQRALLSCVLRCVLAKLGSVPRGLCTPWPGAPAGSGGKSVFEQFRICLLPFPLLHKGIINVGVYFANLYKCRHHCVPDNSLDTSGSPQKVFVWTHSYLIRFPKLMTDSGQHYFCLPTQVFSYTLDKHH